LLVLLEVSEGTILQPIHKSLYALAEICKSGNAQKKSSLTNEDLCLRLYQFGSEKLMSRTEGIFRKNEGVATSLQTKVL
jgi:hypothetical protein